jgi:hypothetical protein
LIAYIKISLEHFNFINKMQNENYMR